MKCFSQIHPFTISNTKKFLNWLLEKSFRFHLTLMWASNARIYLRDSWVNTLIKDWVLTDNKIFKSIHGSKTSIGKPFWIFRLSLSIFLKSTLKKMSAIFIQCLPKRHQWILSWTQMVISWIYIKNNLRDSTSIVSINSQKWTVKILNCNRIFTKQEVVLIWWKKKNDINIWEYNQKQLLLLISTLRFDNKILFFIFYRLL